MASIKVQIAPDLLQWILHQTSGMDLSASNYEYLESWANGTKEPTFAQIEKVSKGTGIPLGYFFLKEPPKEDLFLVEYRTVDSIELAQPSRNLIATMQSMQRVQEWLRDIALEEGNPPLQFVGSLKDETSATNFAERMREILSVEIDWYERVQSSDLAFKYLREKVSDAGVTVMMNGVVGNNTRRILNIDEFRAFTLIDEYTPLIFINARDNLNARVFSLLHEFAHICIGENSLFNAKEESIIHVSATETLCNASAAEVLVPRKIFCEEWEKNAANDWKTTVFKLARYFCCSNTVIARRALDFGYISHDQYIEIAAIKPSQKKKENPGGNFYNTVASRIDHHFLKMLANSVRVGKTTPTEAYQLTNTNRSTFSELLSKVLEG